MKGNENVVSRNSLRFQRAIFSALLMLSAPFAVFAQEPASRETTVQQRIQALTEAMNRLEAQMQESQRELAELKQQLLTLSNPSGEGAARPSFEPSDAAQLAEAVAGLRDTQAMHETQIATLAQTKVESDSKYPLKLSGMILMTGFVNTGGVDAAATPAIALGGAGSTGATMQQTILGLDASGPHIFRARSHADLRFDLDGGTTGSPSGTGYAMALLRLRTAHAELNWEHTQAYFALDRSLLNPESPASLTAVAEPALAWSGNLWAWNPQVGISRDVLSTNSGTFRVQTALTDISDPPSTFVTDPAQMVCNIFKSFSV
jgi:hypothetical protein